MQRAALALRAYDIQERHKVEEYARAALLPKGRELELAPDYITSDEVRRVVLAAVFGCDVAFDSGPTEAVD